MLIVNKKCFQKTNIMRTVHSLTCCENNVSRNLVNCANEDLAEHNYFKEHKFYKKYLISRFEMTHIIILTHCWPDL